MGAGGTYIKARRTHLDIKHRERGPSIKEFQVTHVQRQALQVDIFKGANIIILTSDSEQYLPS